MIVGHRWEYDHDLMWYRCVPLPIGGVESHQWCIGCGCRVADSLLAALKVNHKEEHIGAILDLIALKSGHEPVEAGTFPD